MASLTLYAEPLWISPYVFSTFVGLTEKGTAFDIAAISIGDREHLATAYSERSLTERVPALDHDGFVLGESSAIAEYLDEVLPAPRFPRLVPSGVHERARARQLMAWLRSDLGALREERATTSMFYRFRLPPLSPAARRDAEKLERVAERCVLHGGGPLFGEWCLADAELAFMLHRLILNGESVGARLRTYAEAQWSRPSVRAFVEHPRPKRVPTSYWAFNGIPEPEPLP